MRSKAPYDVALRRAERGYQWLVTKGPRYGLDVSRVQVEYLDLAKAVSCVVTRASEHANFNQIYQAVRGHRPVFWNNWRWGIPNGFLLNINSSSYDAYDTQGVSYRILTKAWVEVINSHRAVPPSTPSYTTPGQKVLAHLN